MSSTFVPPSSTAEEAKRRAPSETVHRIVNALAIVTVIAAFALAVTLVTGATAVFNFVVFCLFTFLWIAFAAAVLYSPGTLDDMWHALRSRHIVVQVVVWLLFLPLALGLFIWEQRWASPLRLLLVAALAAWNILMFFPRG